MNDYLLTRGGQTFRIQIADDDLDKPRYKGAKLIEDDKPKRGPGRPKKAEGASE